MNIYRPQRSCGQGYVFTRVCDSVHRGGLRRPPRDQADTPRDQGEPPRQGEPPPGPGIPPRQGEPPPRTKESPPGPGRPPPGPGRTPPARRTPPPEEDCSIWSMSGRYASYWNAFLLHFVFTIPSMVQIYLLGP